MTSKDKIRDRLEDLEGDAHDVGEYDAVEPTPEEKKLLDELFGGDRDDADKILKGMHERQN